MSSHERRRWFIRFFENLFLLGLFKRLDDSEGARKMVLVNTITLSAIIVLIVVGTLTYIRGNAILALLDLSAAGMLAGCIVSLRATGRHRVPIYVGMAIMTGLYYYLFFSGGAGGTGYLWYYTYPLFTLYIMGKRDGLVANAILFGPSFVYLVAIWGKSDALYTQDFTIRFIPSSLCVLIFSYLFEATRQKTHGKLEEKQHELEASIQDLRDKEADLQKARDSLETKVEERTKALKESKDVLVNEIEERKRVEKKQKALETQLLLAKKMQAIGTLAGGVAHDLNNILSGITSYPELMLTEIPQESPLRKPLMTMQASGQKAAAIVQDLLAMSRRGAIEFDAIDLKAVVQEYLKSPEFDKIQTCYKGVSFRTGFTSPPFTIAGSAVHISKAIMNLVTNATESMEAMSDGGEIRIELEGMQSGDGQIPKHLQTGQYVKMTVSDTGMGIAPDVIERIYEPFFTTKKMGRSGTGLGMAVVWGTVQDHHGHIHVQSEPGKGTVFDIWFPAAQPDARQQAEAVADLVVGNNEAILVVDDLEEQREIAGVILTKLRYRVHTVASGEEAIGYLRTRDVDLIVLDMTMEPGINGLETFRRILEFKPKQRAIIATGFSDSDLVEKALNLGARTCLKKPYTISDIAKAVRDGLCDD